MSSGFKVLGSSRAVDGGETKNRKTRMRIACGKRPKF